MTNDKNEILRWAAIKYLVGVLKLTSFYGSTPYKWDAGQRQVLFIQNGRRRLQWLCHNLVYVCYLIFVFFRWLQFALFLENSSMTSPAAMATLYVFCCYMMVLGIQWSVWKNWGHHHVWMNLYLNYFLTSERRSNGAHYPSGEKVVDCTPIIKSFTIACSIIFTLDTMSVFGGPNAPYFITSLLPGDPRSYKFHQILPLALCHVFIWVHQMGTIFFYFNSIVCYLTAVENILHKLGTMATKRSVEAFAFASEYRRLQVCQSFFNQIWSMTNVVYESAFMIGTILAYYGAVKLDGARAVHQTVVGFVLTFHLLNLWETMGNVFETSSKVLRAWSMWRGDQKNGHEDQRWLKQILRSMSPLKVQMGGYFYVDRAIKLTILEIIFDKTTSLLLST